jgi:hypothetical protein
MLTGPEKNGIIPCLPFTKDIAGIDCEPFIDYRTNTPSSNLPLPSYAYWHSLVDILTSYERHNDNKFDYGDQGIAHRKHIVVNRIRYIGKESNNLDEASVLGIDDDSYLEYENIKDFKQWILSLKPKDVRDQGISKQSLSYTKSRIRKGSGLIRKTKINEILLKLYKQTKLNL